MSAPKLTADTPRLTDLPGDKNPFICQGCGGSNRKGAGNGLMRESLNRWQECDHRDRPEYKIVVLCNKCTASLIKPHPRLYHEIEVNSPWPGCMEICVECRLRDGVTCTAPEAKVNGGAGVVLVYPEPPVRGFIDGKKTRGIFERYKSPATGCRQKKLWQPVK